MSKQSNGGFVSLADSENDSKVITTEDVRLSRLIKPSPLQKRLARTVRVISRKVVHHCEMQELTSSLVQMPYFVSAEPNSIKKEQLKKSRKASGSNGSLLKGHTNGVSSSKNGIVKHSSNPDERPLFQPESDSDEELNVTHYTEPPSVAVTQNSKNLADCTQQLLKDGYRLDEISDEEDLDLIPPRPVDDRCQCCGAVTWQGCVIS